MHRGPSNSDYHRTSLPQTPYGHPPGSGAPFSDAFCRAPFPPPYRGPLGPPPFSNPIPGPPPFHPPGSSTDNFGGVPSRDPFYEVAPPKQFQPSQSSQAWSAPQTDLQSLEVRKKAEEFLRVLEAQDRLELSAEKSSRREDEEISETGFSTRSKSRARSRARSKSRHRSRSRSRGKSRGRSRGRSRSRSRSRGKSRPRAKSRARSRSRGRVVVRSKSQPRLDSRKDSHWSAKDSGSSGASTSGWVSPAASTVPDLVQGLKHILHSKELEKHLSVVKSALLRNQMDEVRVKQDSQPVATSFQKLPELSQKLWEPESSCVLAQSALLPHERVGEGASSFPRILSWDDPSHQPEVKPMFPSIEDEEEFLYGEEEGRTKPQAVTVPLAQTRPVLSPVESLLSLVESPYLSKSTPLQGPEPQQLQVQTRPSRQTLAPDTAKVTMGECEKVKNLLKTIGLNLGMADISKMAARLKQKQVEQRGAPPPGGVASHRPALETLPALCKAPKSEDSRSNRSGSSHSHRDPDRKEKQRDEKERREKQIQMKRKEYLVKELEGLLKQEGSGDLIPVIGFFCQRCEEFFGDLSSAQGHGACHKRDSTQKVSLHKVSQNLPRQQKDTEKFLEPQHGQHPPREARPPESRNQRQQDACSPATKRPKVERSSPLSSLHGLDSKEAGADEGSGGKTEAKGEKKKKKKKEKKMKKKERKKKKKKKAEKDAGE